MLSKIIRVGIYTMMYDSEKEHYYIAKAKYPISKARWKTQSAALGFLKRITGLHKRGI